MNVFEFHNVTRRFRSKLALEEFSLIGERGEVIALLGENGAGKTTALRILLGFERATSGQRRCSVCGANNAAQRFDVESAM